MNVCSSGTPGRTSVNEGQAYRLALFTAFGLERSTACMLHRTKGNERDNMDWLLAVSFFPLAEPQATCSGANEKKLHLSCFCALNSPRHAASQPRPSGQPKKIMSGKHRERASGNTVQVLLTNVITPTGGVFTRPSPAARRCALCGLMGQSPCSRPAAARSGVTQSCKQQGPPPRGAGLRGSARAAGSVRVLCLPCPPPRLCRRLRTSGPHRGGLSRQLAPCRAPWPHTRRGPSVFSYHPRAARCIVVPKHVDGGEAPMACTITTSSVRQRGSRSRRRRASCMASGVRTAPGSAGMAESQAPACRPDCERQSKVLGAEELQNVALSENGMKVKSCVTLPTLAPQKAQAAGRPRESPPSQGKLPSRLALARLARSPPQALAEDPRFLPRRRRIARQTRACGPEWGAAAQYAAGLSRVAGVRPSPQTRVAKSRTTMLRNLPLKFEERGRNTGSPALTRPVLRGPGDSWRERHALVVAMASN